MSFTVDQVSRLYRIPVNDYNWQESNQYRDDDWLLVSSGCGIMMAIMDTERRFRWCVDVDSIKSPMARFDDWLLCMEQLTARICVAGWFSLTRPEILRNALQQLTRPVLVYAGDIRKGSEEPFPDFERAETLGDFLDRLKANPVIEGTTALQAA